MNIDPMFVENEDNNILVIIIVLFRLTVYALTVPYYMAGRHAIYPQVGRKAFLHYLAFPPMAENAILK